MRQSDISIDTPRPAFFDAGCLFPALAPHCPAPFLIPLNLDAMEHRLQDLIDIMAKLRDPEGGCPWDVEQTFASIAPYTIEEGYEVAEAAEAGDMDALCDELGDLLLQVVFHARMAEEIGAFAMRDVLDAVCGKMVRRHPHVFADASVADTQAQSHAWEAQKADERRAKAEAQGRRQASALDDISVALPALTRAEKLQMRAARVGFDWPDLDPVLAKIDEEIAEVRHEIAIGAPRQRLEDEVGDLLFASVNLARKLGLDPEQALRFGNAKFERRFRAMEGALAADNGRPMADTTAWTAWKRPGAASRRRSSPRRASPPPARPYLGPDQRRGRRFAAAGRLLSAGPLRRRNRNFPLWRLHHDFRRLHGQGRTL